MDAGQTMEPFVSVPMAAAHIFAETATPEPELEPHGFRSIINGFRVWPPLPLQPLLERVDLKFAHSLRLVLAIMIAPACSSFSATHEF